MPILLPVDRVKKLVDPYAKPSPWGCRRITRSETRAAGSARSHFHDVQCSTARIKGTRGTRYFAPDALSQPVASTP